MSDISQLERFAENLRRITKDADKMMHEIGEKFAAGYISTAKRETPVKTGNLRRSWDVDDITTKGHRTDVTIVNPVEYAVYVDKGHRVGESGWVDGHYMTDKAEESIERNERKWAQPIIDKYLGGVNR